MYIFIVAEKPPYGAVQPAVFGVAEQSYSCKVWQVLIGLDKLMVLPYQREQGGFDPVRARVKTVTEQINLHLELDFAQKFFKSGVWQNEWQGAAAANATQKKFKKFDTDTDPVAFIDEVSNLIRRGGRKRPNKMALGVDVFSALKNNAAIKERIKYSGTTQNPAVVTEQVLAQIFGLDSVIILDATYNAAPHGQPEEMKFACDPKGALLLYAPENPALDTPSAGYIFAWLIDGRNYIAIEEHDGASATHSDFLEGLMSFDIRKTGDDLAVYLSNCTG